MKRKRQEKYDNAKVARLVCEANEAGYKIN